MLTVHEHSYEETLLPGHAATILDLGCRGFEFTNHFRDLGHVVLAVDCDELPEINYLRRAITDKDGRSGIHRVDGNPLATSITEGDEVPCMTLASLSEAHGVKHWDLIKMDIEGSEREVITSLTHPPATQLSIEFHVHVYGVAVMEELVGKLTSLGYTTAKHLPTPNGNYYDSVFILNPS